MRFDDRLATVMAAAGAGARAQAARWRQLVDLLAQRRRGEAEPGTAAAFSILRGERPAIPLEARREIAESLAGRAIAPDLFAFFADDHPSVAAPLVAGARLTPDQWLAVLPALSPTARALLRHRRDLAPGVEQALASFGASDFVISGEAGAPQAEVEVRRRPRKERARPAAPATVQPAAADIDSFRWETGTGGTILWVEDAPRGAIVGQTIAGIAGPGQEGVDGQAAGAFEKRAPFRDARFSIAGSGAAAGDWRISGVPFFDPAAGSFLGYRGTARRPRLDEVARSGAAQEPSLFGADLPADALRQLVHELRTPLNAVVGFAEMIDGQYLGPAGAAYRRRAADIVAQAGRLLSAVDDLDVAARLESGRYEEAGDAGTDAAALLGRLHESYARIAAQRDAAIALAIAPGLPLARVEAGALERMFARLLAATIGLVREGETLETRLTLASFGGALTLSLAVDRPGAVAGIDESALLDPGYSPDGDWPAAPALGLGFALRLVRNLAEAAGGALAIEPHRFILYLPAAEGATALAG